MGFRHGDGVATTALGFGDAERDRINRLASDHQEAWEVVRAVSERSDQAQVRLADFAKVQPGALRRLGLVVVSTIEPPEPHAAHIVKAEPQQETWIPDRATYVTFASPIGILGAKVAIAPPGLLSFAHRRLGIDKYEVVRAALRGSFRNEMLGDYCAIGISYRQLVPFAFASTFSGTHDLAADIENLKEGRLVVMDSKPTARIMQQRDLFARGFEMSSAHIPLKGILSPDAGMLRGLA